MSLVIPGWPLALIIMLETALILGVHRHMTVFEKVAIALPALILAILYVALDLFSVPPSEMARSVLRVVFFFWFFWKSVFLYITRKRHI